MSIRRMYLFTFIYMACFIAALATATYGYVFKVDWYTFLMVTKVFSIPLVLFMMGSSIIFGGICGWVVGDSVKKNIDKLNRSLLELKKGNYQHSPALSKEIVEFNQLWERFRHIQKRLEEQTTASQKATNDRVLWHEQMKQEVVSQERNRLARELHDSVSQQLFAASMLLSAINEQENKESDLIQKQLKLVEEIVTETQSEMRALLLHLRPVQLEGKSLTSGMEELLQELSSKQLIGIFWGIDNVHLKRGVEDHLFRIVQEAISNTLRHAKAKTLEIRLMKTNHFVLLKIIDDGIGFEIVDQKIGSYGLQNIQERVKEIGGTIKLISLPNKGTSIEVRVPIIEQKNEDIFEQKDEEND